MLFQPITFRVFDEDIRFRNGALDIAILTLVGTFIGYVLVRFAP